MPDSLYTKKQFAQFRGPTTSDDYNNRIENLYKDLVYLYNKLGISEENIRQYFQSMAKEQLAITQVINDLEARIAALEEDANILSFYSSAQIDNDRFDGTSYEVVSVNRLYHNSAYGILALPRVDGSSVSKIQFLNSNGEVALPPDFEVMVQGDASSADSTGALIDTSDVHNAFLGKLGRVWERNVIVQSVDPQGAIIDVYVRLPLDLATTPNSNVILINPFPSMGCDILNVEYSLDADPLLNDTDDYHTLNISGSHDGNDSAVGWIAPGAWSGDIILNSGPKAFYFDPKPISAIRVRLRQRNYLNEGGKYVYSYGLSKLDVRFDKFLETGKAIFRFDAPDGDTISSVTNVLPQIWNVSEAELPYVFDYRVIWETSFDSDIYTLNPVASSQRVWIEVSLNKTMNKGTPALSGLSVSYT